MRVIQLLKALGPVDAKNVRRDAMLRWLAAYPIALALVLRWGAPALNVQLRARAEIDLVPYYPLLGSFVVLGVPTIIGFVIGFLLLDQRDDHTLTALRVTPLPLHQYLAYRVAAPFFLSIAMIVVAVPLTGLVVAGVGAVLLAAVCAAPLAPLGALFVASFAQNKVQGFALAKASGVLLWMPILAYFVDSRWQLAFGIVPQYWPAKVFWMFEAGAPWAWGYWMIGVAYQILVLGVLLRRCNAVLGR